MFKYLTIFLVIMLARKFASVDDTCTYVNAVSIVKTYSEPLRERAILMATGDWTFDDKQTLQRFAEFKSAMDTLKGYKGIDSRIDSVISEAEKRYNEVVGVYNFVSKEKVSSPLPQEFINKLREIEPKLDNVTTPKDTKLLCVSRGPLTFWPTNDLSMQHVQELYKSL
jgi:hypothetical protein